MFYVYIIESIRYGTYYIGQTNNLPERLRRHNNGIVKSTKSRKPYRLCYFEEFDTRSEAMFREYEIKKKYNTERRRKMIISFDRKIIEKISGL
jgi:putative endonuclease